VGIGEDEEKSMVAQPPGDPFLVSLSLWARRRQMGLKRLVGCLRRPRFRCPFAMAAGRCLLGFEEGGEGFQPLSRVFGFDRGQPIDRYYIERFLQNNKADIRGRVLEIGDSAYTRRFGGKRVTRSDVLHAEPGNPKASLVGDLTTGKGIPKETFDCIILTQTLNVVYDVRGAVDTLYASLRPGGVVLATVPGIGQISRYDMERWGDFWRFTSLSLSRLFVESFPETNVAVESYGSALTATSLLLGVVTEELDESDLHLRDPDYEVVVCVRASKPGADE